MRASAGSEGGFAALVARFEAALKAGRAVASIDYRLCGEVARMRIAGEGLQRVLLPVLEHLSVGMRAAADLHIDVWDAAECGGEELPTVEREAGGKEWDLTDGRFFASADGRFVCHQSRGLVAWLDRRRGHLLACFADSGELTLNQRGKPLQMLLALRGSDRGIQAVHAACVGRAGVGVLVPGHSGAGKSTVSLACLQAGFECLGDDWVGAARADTGALVGHGLFASLYLEGPHAQRFARLGIDLQPACAAGEEKSLILGSRLFPGQFAPEARIGAVALSRFVPERRATTLRPATRAEVLLSLVPSSVFTLRPRLGAEGVERLAELAREVPGYWLETGTDLERIPGAVDEILAAFRG